MSWGRKKIEREVITHSLCKVTVPKFHNTDFSITENLKIKRPASEALITHPVTIKIGNNQVCTFHYFYTLLSPEEFFRSA
jgi:hypothetical protein